MLINRRTFSAAAVAAAAVSLVSTRSIATSSAPTKARNVVLVHGLFADGSCRSEVIARLQAAGLNATAVQNPLTTLPEAVASAERVLARQDGPAVLVGHSFSGMILTEAGVHPTVSALVYVAARAPDAGEDYTALAKTYSTPPATAGIVFDGVRGTSRRGGIPARFRWRPADGKGKGALCGPRAVPQGSAHGQNDAGGMAIEAELLCRLHRRPHNQSRPSALHGQADGGQDDRS
jgi:pimeloyl-ACP methyl ester carboxylesterase